VKTIILVTCALCGTAGCATRQPDHFYVLAAQPSDIRDSLPRNNLQAALRLTLPSLVDRNEMVLATPDGVAVMEHERWAAPLADLMATTLRQDFERRRGDVLISRWSADPGISRVRIEVDIVQLSARRGSEVSIETQWRVTDAGHTSIGREVFVAPVHSDSYAALASALSTCVGLLADRLVKEFPPG
jgi:uncharacterized lipoprotein YmbA